MGSSIALAAVAAALAIQSATNYTPAPLKPTSPWVVDYADKMCILQRVFGTGSEQITVGLKPAPAGVSMTVVMLTPNNAKRVTNGDATLTFDGQSMAKSRYIAGPVRGKEMRITAIDFKRDELTELPQAKQIRIEAGNVDATIAPNRLPDALRALSACEADLLATWGMDAKVIANIADYPTIDADSAAAFFSPDDYPTEALARGEQGLAGARVFVSTDGNVRECSIIESSGSASIDAKTCAIVRKRFRYKPARLRTGESVASFTYARVRWEIGN